MRNVLFLLFVLLLLSAFIAVPSMALSIAGSDVQASEVLAQSVDPNCPGSLMPRLRPGVQGRVAQSFSTLRSAAGGPGVRIMPGGSVFTVLEGPVCATPARLNYFRIDYGNGITGWANESQVVSEFGSNRYWLEPLGTGGPVTPTPTRTPTPAVTPIPPTAMPAVGCAGSPPPRLRVGQQGVVAQRFSTLRAAPASESVIRVMPGGSVFTVLEGPVCAGYGPLSWYRIDYGNGLIGWASEGQVYSEFGSNQYWLAPRARAGS